LSREQARKSRDNKRRKIFVIRTATGEEYEAFVREKCDAISYARQRGLKVDAVYLSSEKTWNKNKEWN